MRLLLFLHLSLASCGRDVGLCDRVTLFTVDQVGILHPIRLCLWLLLFSEYTWEIFVDAHGFAPRLWLRVTRAPVRLEHNVHDHEQTEVHRMLSMTTETRAHIHKQSQSQYSQLLPGYDPEAARVLGCSLTIAPLASAITYV